MRQKNKQRLRLIGLLMLFSILLLVQFSTKWLIAQYKEERQLLHEGLNELLAKTRERMIDSAIHIEFSTNNIIPADSLSFAQDKAQAHTQFSVIKSQTTTTISKRDNIVGQTKEEAHIFADTAVIMPGELENGIKRYVIRLDPANAEKIAFMDSGRLLRIFAKEADSVFHLPVTHQQRADTTREMLLNTGLGYYLSVEHYRSYLLKKLGTQIGFTVLLICLCSGAFLLAFATLRRQLLLNAHKDNFISNMSHELKTPVATAKVAIESLSRFNGIEDPVKTRDYLQMAGWEIDRLETLVNNVLSNVQLEDGRLHMQFEDTDMAILIASMMEHMQPLFREKQKAVLFRNNMQSRPIVSGDKTHLQGMLYNVIDNALKYGGNHIVLSLAEDTGRLSITISDNGPGIPAAFSDKVFDRFFRVPSGDVHNVKGYGLGLNYARYVAIAHKGNIRQYNGPEGGATFEIRLPLKQRS